MDKLKTEDPKFQMILNLLSDAKKYHDQAMRVLQHSASIALEAIDVADQLTRRASSLIRGEEEQEPE